MAVRRIAHPGMDDRKEKGPEARDQAPLSSHTKGVLLRAAPTRSPCCRSGTPTWCRAARHRYCGTASPRGAGSRLPENWLSDL
jgi:hypothetical protein